MSRQSGSANLAASLEVLAGAPLDARSKVPLKTDLTTASNFPYPYEGMQVYVAEEKKTYTLIGSDVTVLANWQENGSGGGTGGGHVIEENGTALTQRDTLNLIDLDAEDDSTNEKTQVSSHRLSQEEMAEIFANQPGPATPTDFDTLINKPTKDVTPISDVATPLPSVMSRRFKYSTEEQIVGEWIDGKPIYQKTVTGTTKANDWKSTDHNIANIDSVVKVDCGLYHSGAYFDIGGAYGSDGRFLCKVTTSTVDIYVAPSGFGGDNFVCTFQYTKTTD